jgi:hypothetical protein
MTTTTATTDRAAVLAGLARFIAQRSGIDWRNYYSDGRDAAGVAACREDYNKVLRDGRQARRLLAAVEARQGIDVAELIAASRGDRLTLSDDGARWDFTACQYFPTEYRMAACRVLAAALWQYWRADGLSRDEIQKQARRTLGRAIAARWFN